MLSLVAISLLLALLAGSVMLYLGLRGRRVSHRGAYCRKCGYDLTSLLFIGPGAKAQPLSTAPTHCPECGRACNTPRSVQPYRRQRITWLWLSGVTLLFLLTLTLGAGLYLTASGGGAYKHLPRSVLLVLSRFSISSGSDTIAQEMLRRMEDAANPIPPAERRAIGLWLLDRQADPRFTWSPFWGDVVVRCVAAGDLNIDEYNRFVRQIFKVEASLPAIGKPGHYTPVRLKVTHHRGTSGDDQSMPIYLRKITIGGREVWNIHEVAANRADQPLSLDVMPFLLDPRVPQFYERKARGATRAVGSWWSKRPRVWYSAIPSDLALDTLDYTIEFVLPDRTVADDQVAFAALRTTFTSRGTITLVSELRRPQESPSLALQERMHAQFTPGTPTIDASYGGKPDTSPVALYWSEATPISVAFDVMVHVDGKPCNHGSIVVDHTILDLLETHPPSGPCRVPVTRENYDNGVRVTLQPNPALADFFFPDRAVYSLPIVYDSVMVLHKIGLEYWLDDRRSPAPPPPLPSPDAPAPPLLPDASPQTDLLHRPRPHA